MGSFASDIAQIVPRVEALEAGTPIFTTETVAITAGPGGDHSTLNAALAAASRLQAVQYAKGGLFVTITLKTGYTATVADQVIVDGVDLGFVTILSEDDEVPVATGTRAVLTAGIIGSDLTAPLIGGRNKAVIPTIGCLFAFPDDGDGYCATASDGVALHTGARGQVLPGCGVLRARRGCQVLYGSEINCYIPGLTQGGAGSGADATGTGTISGTTLTISATTRAGFTAGMRVGLIGIAANTEIEEQLTGTPGGNGTYRVNISQTVASNPVTAGIYGASFRHASNRALHVGYNSRAGLARARLDHGRGDYGAYIIWNSAADLYQAQIHDSTGYAITCRDGSTCNARETQVARSARGYHALHNSTINARSKDTDDLPGNPWVGDSAKDCTGYGVLASYSSNIDAAQVDVSGCGNRGVHASNGSTINFLGGVANDCASYGIYAFDGSTISASGAVADDCGAGFAAGDNSTISADTSSAQRSTVGGYVAEEGGTIHARNSNADGVSGTLPPIGFYAYRGGTINCRGSTARYCDLGFYAYEGSHINAQSGNAANAGTWGFKVERGGTMTIGDATGGVPLGTYNVAQLNVTGPDGVIYDSQSKSRGASARDIGGGINLLRDIDITSHVACIQRRSAGDDNAPQSLAVDPVNRNLYILQEQTSGTLGAISRVIFNDTSPVCLAAADVMNGSPLIGHQGFDIWHKPDGSVKLLVTDRTNGRRFLAGSYAAGADFVSDGAWTLFDTSFTANPTYSMPKFSVDGKFLMGRAKWPNGDTVIRAFRPSILDNGPGDYSQEWLWQITVPLTDLGSAPLQDYRFDGILTVLAGYGAWAVSPSPVTPTIFLRYELDGTPLEPIYRDFDDDRVKDGAGEAGQCEPEGFYTWQADDCSPRTIILMGTGPSAFRIAHLYSIGWRKRTRAADKVDEVQAAILAVDPAQRLTYDQMDMLEGFYRALIGDGLLDNWGLLYALAGRNIGLGEAFSRMNLVNPGQGTLTRYGSTTDPFVNGYYAPNGTDDYLDTGVGFDYLPGYFRKVGQMSLYLPINMQAAGGTFGSNPGGSAWSRFAVRSTGNNCIVRSQNNVDTTVTGVTDSRGWHSVIRRTEASFVYRRNAFDVVTSDLVTSGTPVISRPCFGCSATSYSAQPIAFAALGRPFDDAGDARMMLHVQDLLSAMRVVI